LRRTAADEGEQLLAIIEAEVGSLLELLPVPLLVTSEHGEVLRANEVAGAFLDSAECLIGKHIDTVLGGQPISIKMRTLSHAGQTLRLYALQHQADGMLADYPG
jgi:PAS domain-containing protein